MKNILIVEDTKLHQQKIKDIITSLDYNVAGIFSEGQKALEYVFAENRDQPDLVICDIVLEGNMNGCEVAEEISKKLNIPIIFLTGSENRVEINLENSRASVFLNKPFSKEELKYNIELVLQKNEMQKKLKMNIQEKEMLLENIPIQIWYLKDPKTYGAVNRSFADFLGVDKGSIEDKKLHDVLKAEEAQKSIEINKKVFSDREEINNEQWITDKKGEKRLLAINRTPGLDEAKQVEYVVCSARDITAEHKLEKRLRKNRNYLQSIINAIPDIIILFDEEGNYLDIWTSELEDLVASKEEQIGKNIKDILSEDVTAKHKKYLSKAIEEDGKQTFEYELAINDSKKYFEAHFVALSEDREHDNREVLAVIRNITERQKQKEKIKELSLNDPLTGLYNRRFFEQEITRLNDSRRLPISIIVADLDNLKFINDNYGHHIGDKYIKKAGKIFQNCVRKSDIVARVGGDEYSVILPETDADTAQNLCCRIQSRYENFNKSSDLPEPLSVSLGAATKTNLNEDLNEIFNIADQRMYKNKGRKR